MGVLYSVVPLDESIASYLRDVGVALPESSVPSRNPTPLEVRAVVAKLTDLDVTVYSPPEHAWQVMIHGKVDPDNEPWTLLNVWEFNGDETMPHFVGFEKGWPSLILRIVHGLSVYCGPLVLIPDTGGKPVVISASDDVTMLFQVWEHTGGVDR